MQSSQTYVRDSSHFLELIEGLGPIPDDAILVTADVVGLYPNIPHEEGLQALGEALDRRSNNKIPTNVLMEMTEFVLKNNFFEFDSKTYHQKLGTAIGTKFAPPYACIFMDKLEKGFLQGQQLTPWLWLRYIDDVFFIWTHGREELKAFLRALNSFHDTIKFTFEMTHASVNSSFEELESCTLLSGRGVNFLDLNVWLDRGKLESDMYCKPTDCHQYLHYTSCHPPHIKRSIVYSQALRIKRLCSSEGRFLNHLNQFKQWFTKRGYPSKVITEQCNKAKSHIAVPREDQTSSRPRENVTPLVVTYHPAFTNLSTILRKHFHVLQITEGTKRVFSSAPFVSFRNPKTLRNSLVRAKLPKLEIRKGTFRCKNSRCEVCLNLVETNEFIRSSDGKIFKINYELGCNSTCLIYLMTCKICKKQLVGECTTRWRDRWNNYRDNGRKALDNKPHLQAEVHAHFKLPGHTTMETDVDVILIDKTDSMFPKKREKFWIRELCTMTPDGINVSESW